VARSNADVVREAIAALNDRDVERYLTLCAPGIELLSPAAPLEGALVGERGIRGFFAQVDESVQAFELAIETLEEVTGDRVLVTGTLTATSTAGVTIAQTIYNVYDLESGRLRRVRGFFDRERADAAAAEPR
jgi:ketosteroid isomerase-like protein